MRASVTKRNSKTLGVAKGNVCPELAGRLQEGQAKQIRCDCHQRSGPVGAFNKRTVIIDRAEGVRVLDQGAKNLVVELERAVVAHHNFQSKRLRARAHHIERLGMALRGYEE